MRERGRTLDEKEAVDTDLPIYPSTHLPVQVNAATTRGGVTGRGFRPGKSGNPGGRPQGVAHLVRRLTHGGKDAIEALRVIALEPDEKVQAFFGTAKSPSMRDRREAAGMLLDRLFGRPAQTLSVAAIGIRPEDIEQSKHSLDEKLEQLRQRMTEGNERALLLAVDTGNGNGRP